MTRPFKRKTNIKEQEQDNMQKNKIELYGPSGSFTKAAKGTAKITTFMSKRQLIPDDFDDVLDDMENEEPNCQLDLNKRIEILKIKLKE
ncbi:hypothetical protein C1645_813409 [Glomus cerebriforme]|uniref:Uncharacterized protein n=1 Tax=Glomus cerebriforme TaxID=658196 RepID=A0A397TIF9_9GLOM|nr:hypothetical protein C1645_813409 [Glomus cerebriforme]